MTIEADYQRDEGCVDELKAEVAADDVLDPLVESCRHAYNIFKDAFGDDAHRYTQHPYREEVEIGLPLPCREGKRLENSQR